jgi:hypothetical protein
LACHFLQIHYSLLRCYTSLGSNHTGELLITLSLIYMPTTHANKLRFSSYKSV